LVQPFSPCSCTALVACSLRTHIVQLQLRIEKLRKNPQAFDVPSDPAEERTAADIVQVSEMVSVEPVVVVSEYSARLSLQLAKGASNLFACCSELAKT
jgi:hypothetical protein